MIRQDFIAQRIPIEDIRYTVVNNMANVITAIKNLKIRRLKQTRAKMSAVKAL